MKGNAMQLGKTTRSFLALTATGILFATACGDGDDNGMDVKDDGATGGSSGTSAGGASGTSGSTTGGTSGTSGAGGMSGATTGGGAGAGAGGMAGGGAGGMGGKAGAGAGGKAGAGAGGMAGGGMAGMAGGGMAGMAGGGMAGGGMAGAGAGGMSGAGAGGMAGAGAGGMSGGGMGGMAPTMVYDFESGVQGWGGAGTTMPSMTQVKDGAYSLAFDHPALDGTNFSVEVSDPKPPLWPGTVITVNAWLPAGLDTSGGTYFQMFTNFNNYSNYDNAGNGGRTAQSGAWTTWTYTVPNTFPGGIQSLGFQIGDNSGGTTIPAGSIYIDSITATGGVANCAIATPAGSHDFETTPLPADTYLVSGGGNVTVSQSTDRAFGTGTGSLKVSFADLPAGTTSAPTKRFIYINKPNLYCGQTTTFHIWLPAGSEAMAVQVLSVFNWFSGFAGTGNLTVTRDDWTTGTLTIPTTVDYRGIQQVGIEISYTGTGPFTGDAYIDQITWGT